MDKTVLKGLGTMGLVLALWTRSAAGAPMVTSLATVRAEARLVVVGTLESSKAGLAIDVEYAIRGTVAAGRMAVNDSPDGHVFVDRVAANNRVIAFLDQQRRVRWVGRLQAGPRLETGVVRLEGFFDFNAHHVEPGVMSLKQLRSYLSTGKLVQRFRATLAFPDGVGGINRSKRTFVIEHDGLARNPTMVGAPAMACLGHEQLQVLPWGEFRLFLSCRDRARSLHLGGAFAGVDPATGEVLVDVVPVAPLLDEAEFDRYIKDERATGVTRLIDVTAQGKTWRWQLGGGLVGPTGRVLDDRGGSSSSTGVGAATTFEERYRFAGKVSLTITHGVQRPSWQNNDLFLAQLVDGQAFRGCTLWSGGARHACTLKRGAATWVRTAGPKRAPATEAIAVQVAMRFVVDNGYTDRPHTPNLANLSRESLEPADVADRLAQRHDTLEPKAYGVSGGPSSGWIVVFRYKHQPNNPRGRAVLVDRFGRTTGVAHQDFLLDQCARRL